MSKTFYAARLADADTKTYLWKFSKHTATGIYGRKKVDNTVRVEQAMLRATASSIMDNIRDAEQITDFRYEIVEFEAIHTFSAYQFGIQEQAAKYAVDGAFVRTIGDYVYVLRAKDQASDVVSETTMPIAQDGVVQQYGDAVILSTSDWQVVADAVRSARESGVVPADVESRLAAIQFAECVDVEVE